MDKWTKGVMKQMFSCYKNEIDGIYENIMKPLLRNKCLCLLMLDRQSKLYTRCPLVCKIISKNFICLSKIASEKITFPPGPKRYSKTDVWT